MVSKKIYILDTSAILSGKSISPVDGEMLAPESVSLEFRKSGRDYRNFQFLIEKGLLIISPSKNSISLVRKVAETTGDIGRLSNVDIDVLALALDKQKENFDVMILTDDYSIQNVAHAMGIKFISLSQKGIKEEFKWIYVCRGCGKKFDRHIKVCPICGKTTKSIVIRSYKIKR
ncbi:nucleic acid-binding protein [Euryarchaeota archaeon ex4484_162]|nr:NOB1 family endonuclease [Thermoplasmata archaeon]OYT58487.1 MAG: nucleic acid-binding protein [Euryarchaeota archaeon ex4484_162]RLF30058.1 MAG: nucleic acid-binding protein [Thermoplasmata archaeon]RLF61759.1 MAG: nucleic acid-binding protein [Thermoplasmata archaeon]HDM25560.1 NOB1 family endonuclease [Thermoplasmatales archaeon]